MIEIAQEIDSYIKKTIVNTIKNFKRDESQRMKNEIYMSSIFNMENDEETALLSYTDNYAVFSWHLEDNVEDKKLYEILKKLSEEEKEILTLSILEEWTSKEIGKKFTKSDSRIGNIIRDTIAKIRKKYNEEE